MAKPSLGAPAPASPFFSPASDQSSVSHLKVTAQSVTPKPDGSLHLDVVSGNVRFGVTLFNLPGRPDFKTGDKLILEYPRGHNPLTDYSAIYHADAVTQSQLSLLHRSNTVSEKTEILPFNFEDKQIRVVTDDNNEPWFVAADVCRVLEIVKPENAYARLDDDEKGTRSMGTPGGQQEMTIINESGLYSLILTSRKPEAKKFKKWVTSEVLPSIRKTGSYSVKGGSETLHPSVLDQVGTVIQKQLDAMFQAELPRLVHGELARQQIAVRCGVTAGQVWKLYNLDTLKNGPQTLSRLLTAFGCEIDGGGKAEQGGRTAKMFDPDKSDKAMKSGLLEHCQRYIRERNGQHQLFAVKQEKPAI